MKADIHPKYFESVQIRCSCGNIIVAGSTKETLKTELCSKCHPFYTGTQKLVDTAGRVDKFQAKRKKFAVLQEEEKSRLEEKKKKPEAYKEKEIPAEVLERAIQSAKPKGKWGGPLGDAPVEEVIKEEIAVAKSAIKKKPALKQVAKKVPKKTAAKKPTGRAASAKK